MDASPNRPREMDQGINECESALRDWTSGPLNADIVGAMGGIIGGVLECYGFTEAEEIDIISDVVFIVFTVRERQDIAGWVRRLALMLANSRQASKLGL